METFIVRYMALFEPAVEHTLAQEGGFNHCETTGECVKFGINHWTLRAYGILPHQKDKEATSAEVAFVFNMAREYAINFYRRYYWGAIGQINSQRLANKVFDLGVNCGQGTAIAMLQRAVNLIKTTKLLIPDGKLGPATISAVNSLDPDELLKVYKQIATERYKYIADAKPEHAPDLDGWLQRLDA